MKQRIPAKLEMQFTGGDTVGRLRLDEKEDGTTHVNVDVTMPSDNFDRGFEMVVPVAIEMFAAALAHKREMHRCEDVANEAFKRAAHDAKPGGKPA